MLTKSTLQKIRSAYVYKRGSVSYDDSSVERYNIARLILVDVTIGRSVVITLSRLYDGKFSIHSFEGSINYREIKDIEIALNENEQE